ncbi:MAG: hypothetical protein ACRD4A_02040 [Candidatus Acidiferrales bacterium]
MSRLKLESLGTQVDKLTPEQEQYLASWNEGTWPRIYLTSAPGKKKKVAPAG